MVSGLSRAMCKLADELASDHAKDWEQPAGNRSFGTISQPCFPAQATELSWAYRCTSEKVT
jgi:hypothetical protein